MTVTINKMSTGKGYEYLLRTVAAGDGDRSLSTPLTRYYTEAGTPPGQWMGSGVASLGSAIRPGDEVTEEQLKLLIGQGAHPETGEPLGRRYRTYSQPDAGKRRHAVAGYDLTFSIPKSASVLWGVADGGTQALIAEAHHAAVVDALDFLEREVVATRVGAKGPKGAVAQVEVSGVVAAAFDHYDSRANDPHLHTHVVISNKVRTVRDGKWRTIDGAPLHAWVVALSELHEAAFSDHLTRTLGVDWQRRPSGGRILVTCLLAFRLRSRRGGDSTSTTGTRGLDDLLLPPLDLGQFGSAASVPAARGCWASLMFFSYWRLLSLNRKYELAERASTFQPPPMRSGAQRCRRVRIVDTIGDRGGGRIANLPILAPGQAGLRTCPAPPQHLPIGTRPNSSQEA